MRSFNRTSKLRFTSKITSRSFQILEHIEVNNKTPQFMVSFKNGFLPREEPLDQLPSKFNKLEQLLQDMPITKDDGTPGLTATGDFGDRVLRDLPMIDCSTIEDSAVLTALFRDYSFVASSYLLEPCDLNWRKTGSYGLGRQVLPKQIAVPFNQVAQKMGAKPFMEYALSYALYNWKKIDNNKPIHFDNLKLIRKFEGSRSEYGFIGVHVTMVQNTNRLIQSTWGTLQAVGANDRVAFMGHIESLLAVMKDINLEMDTMWKRSKPDDYNNFRTFIMGIKNQPMFPNGVMYEGVDDKPHSYRGESGANDSIIPTCDNLLQITQNMPPNPLTEVLRDFRTYRPSNHSQWVGFVESESNKIGVKNFALGEVNSSVLYQACLDQVREFRHRHWAFTKEYIIRASRHPVATGGSPITTWLPNQLDVVLGAMEGVTAHVAKVGKIGLSPDLAALHDVLNQRAVVERKVLKREVAELSARFENQDKTNVYN